MTREEILSKHTGEVGIYLTKGMVRGSDVLDAMQEYADQETLELRSRLERMEKALEIYAEWDDTYPPKTKPLNLAAEALSERSKG